MSLTGAYFLTVGVSAAVKIFNNMSARNTIERKGYEIDKSKLSTFDRVYDFLSDNFYLVVPIYNLYKSIIKDFIRKKPEGYAKERMEVFKERGILKKIDEKETEDIKEEKISKTKEKEAEVIDEEEFVVRAPKKDVKVEPVTKSNKGSASETKEEELARIKKEAKALIIEYTNDEEEQTLPYEARKAKYEMILNYRDYIASLEKFIQKEKELEDIKKQRDQLYDMVVQKEKKLGLDK